MSFEIFYKLFAYISAFSVIVPLYIAIYKFSQLKKIQVHRYLLIYLTLSLVTELVHILFNKLELDSTQVSNLFSLAEYFLITQIFIVSGLLNKLYIGLVNFSRVIILCAYVYGLLTDWNGIFSGASACFIVLLCIRSYFSLLVQRESESDLRLGNDSIFLIISGILIYFSSTFFLFLFDNTTQMNNPAAKSLWLILLLFNIIFYIFLSRALCKMKIIQ